mmetsp:Transcript_22219/g.56112  ORF Transcript_22219/g.56112 Transcript_22219/m.56112 type:complete len:293 (+) Transcript_22219:134-1012(+)
MPKVTSAMDLAHVGKGKSGAAAKGAAPGGNKKVKFCMYHLQGVCKYTSQECAFAHSMEDMDAARRARKRQGGGGGAGGAGAGAGAGNGGKMTPPTSSGDEFSSDGEAAAPRFCGGDAGGPTAGCGFGSGLYQEHVDMCRAATLSARAGPWPDLVEPMFVEPSPQTGFNMSHDPEHYLDYSTSNNLLYACLNADLPKSAPRRLSDFRGAADFELGATFARLRGGSLGLEACYMEPALAAAAQRGHGRRIAGAPMPTFYTLPNPFVGLAEPKAAAGAPAFSPPPGLDLSCALGA